ncbi:MarR family winged helix-turn-helix transcriptional regulator [Methylotenera sp.]|uniref:MarR family winged helix-turn-helix transcriptional regulator n=1 Tax=Methylotenera sp. TaxID=2051956 RepID=UPI0027366C7E|nr:MarR family transcriptional regulator [Methylotenera sp.]MDP3306846.1 MarR family transcriptional regulator [Methylotenera sp.]
MIQLKDLPDKKVLKKFAAKYPEADVDSVIQFLSILRIGSDLSDALDGFLCKHGLLQGRWWVLILLMREETLTSTPSELAEKSGVSRATMTGLIDGLEREGLVARLMGDIDRRKYSIKLTAAGQAKLDVVMPDYYQRVKLLMSAIPANHRETLLLQLIQLKEKSSVFE